jgi:hypothetical protein
MVRNKTPALVPNVTFAYSYGVGGLSWLDSSICDSGT